MLNWKNIFKSWTGVPVLILVVLASVWVFTNGLPGYKTWQIKRAYEKMNEPYYNDTYGGKTPEETYDLFIDALKAGDVELASRYFVLESQDNWMITLDKYKQGDYLDNFLEELKNTRNKWSRIETNNSDTAAFRYQSLIEENTKTKFEGQKITIPAGNYTNETIFQKYPSGVWKIATL
ncbi:MAG: hypothetical protein A2750_04220 [Candidatus Yanofskybacteria bacterium RIFCSPHIGHO2_01_FULL_45_42]|uniref:DUF4878 domain-containing protein n=2 Tax=Candidatus Yanofskyibacteriota TaxID=1752733 RepID=A0A1F8FLP8_9BACT|nr:MAG: hypothetical protein A2750_04220 [Candidatus Yanofskybacteria bacterium RIFCSPHIGHO2_01_FULL_45_42]OGN13468.1 MAG: hypothetical protein A3J47_03875 [Candidatus Yanofskybacteria bacterium RIFCSPHIGHO2_02_FULL_43_22]